MNLKDFIAKRDNPPEVFWSILIEESQVQSGIWHIEGDVSEVQSVSSVSPRNTKEDLVEAVDTSLTDAIQKLADDFKEPQKSVFGVPSSWVSGGEIKENYLGDIKKICDELTLTPVGFVVLPEAIAHLYKSDEGAPLSGIVVGLSGENIEISVFKLGNLVGTSTVSRSVSLCDDVIEGLSRFEGAAPLPSRFIIYDGREGELEDAKNELLQNSWDGQDKVKFLHTPKVEILNSDRKVLAVSLAGASEMGEVSKVSLKEEIPVGEEVENITPIPQEEAVKDLGFAINEDVTEIKSEKPIEEKIFKKPVTNIKLPTLPKFKLSVTPFIAFIFLTIVGLILGWYFLPQVKLTLFVTPKSFEKEIDLSFDNGNSQIVSSVQKGSKTKSATGRKVIGDKAKGTIEIANGNATSIKLSSGTVLTSSTGLKFITTQEASISGQLLPGSPGTMQVNVSANDIGSQYNLGKGEVFTVGNYSKSLVAGTSTADITGGSSRDISAISKEDRDGLEKELKDELLEKAKEDFDNKIVEDQILIPDLVANEISDENFDHKVGDEADNLKLNLEITAKAVVADKVKLFDFTKTQLKEISPDGFVLRNDQIGYKFKYIDETSGKFNFKANVTANFLPSLDIDNVKSKIKGRSIEVTKNYLDSLPGFRGAEIVYNNRLLGIIKIIPFIVNHIDIEIAAEK